MNNGYLLVASVDKQYYEAAIKLAESIIKALNQIGKKNWLLKCKKARQRIKKNYSIFKMLKKYNYHWKDVCKII